MKSSIILNTQEICNRLNLSDDIIEFTETTSKQIKGNQNFIGRKPSVINSAIVYLGALKLDFAITLKEIHDVTKAKEESIKNMTFYISNVLDIDIPEKHLAIRKNGIVNFCLHTTGSRKRNVDCHNCKNKEL